MLFSVISWNVNSIRSRIEHLLHLIEKYSPDIVCLQEIKCEDSDFPCHMLDHLNYNIYVCGQSRYNGVAILSKNRASEVNRTFIGNILTQEARFIEILVDTVIGFVRVISLYCPNGQHVCEENPHFRKKIQFYDSFTSYIESFDKIDEKIILAGDLNIAPFDLDVYEPSELEEHICFSVQEKGKLRALFNWGFVDNFRLLNPKDQKFSWWDYRGRKFEKNLGYRIDFTLSTPNLMNYLKSTIIDEEFRKLSKPSDHAPVISVWEK